MTKTNHFVKRSIERGIDDLTLSILNIFGEKLGKRDGITISKMTYEHLKSLATEMRRTSPQSEKMHSY